jgi:arginine deiminase
LLGVGLRTNVEAAEQLMKKDLFGTTHVAVVHDHFEQDQARMHLDCVFNILGRDCVVRGGGGEGCGGGRGMCETAAER